MDKLTPKEEEIMKVVWQKKQVFVKEIRAALAEPKPHINTIATVMSRLLDKGYVDYENFGSTYRYFPKISQKAYAKQFLGEKITSFFDHSYKKMVAFFAEEEKISIDELKEIINEIEKGEE